MAIENVYQSQMFKIMVGIFIGIFVLFLLGKKKGGFETYIPSRDVSPYVKRGKF